jgi:hypothetical protein
MAIQFDNTNTGTLTLRPGASGTYTLTFPAAVAATNGFILSSDTSGNLSWVAVAATPAGSNTQIQFNNSGVLGASANLTWNGSALAITGALTISGAMTSTSTAPFSLQGNSNTGTFNQTVIYANQNNTSGNTANGIFIERGRLTDGAAAEIRSFVIGSRGGEIQLILNKDGNVGIGTSTPSGRLHLFQTAGGSNILTLDTNFSSGNAYAINPFISGVSNGGFSIRDVTNSAERIVISATAGNIGMGMTTPQYRLDVNNGVTGSNSFQASFGATFGSGIWSGIHFGYSEAANANYRKSAIVFERSDAGIGDARGKIHILNATAGATSATLADARFTIGPTGNVGISQTNPVAKFEVSGTAGQLLAVTDSMTGTIFAANDASGIPSIEVIDTGLVKLAEYGGFVAYGVSNAVSAAGTTQATATLLTRPINNISTVGANSGVILPSAYPGMRVLVRNATVTTVRIYPGTGAQINTLGANVQLNLETLANIEFVAFTSTQWYTVNATFA